MLISPKHKSFEIMLPTSLLLFFLLIKGVLSQSCPDQSDLNSSPCLSVGSWEDFETILSTKQSEKYIFCPFSISKDTIDPLVIDDKVSILCQQPGECIIGMSAFSGGKGGRFIKITGSQAQVTIYGFVFLHGGDHSTGVLGSTIHIGFKAGDGKTQVICNSDFTGNKGSIRGAAIRAEPETFVSLIDNKFEGNVASSIGTVFNRGMMRVEGCEFLNNVGVGGALGSSSKSTTFLKRNSFVNNKEGPPLFFHEPLDYVDEGGNVAYGNSCNGPFIFLGQLCVSFNSLAFDEAENNTPVDSTTKTISQQTIANPIQTAGNSVSCERPITDSDSCISVDLSFATLKNLLENGAGQMVFCPFTVQKTVQDFIFITSDIEIICSTPRTCNIKGPGRHLVVNGSSAKLFVQGFVFQDASGGAIHIEGATAHIQSLCNNDFIGNKGSTRGLGVLAEWRTVTEVSHCRFIDCQSSDMGGAIFNRGTMLIENSFFQGNKGRGASVASAPRSTVRFKNNQFIENFGGNPIFFHENDVVDLGDNTFLRNKDCSCCNGATIQRENRRCIVMNNPASEQFSITQSPTSAPVELPILPPEFNAPRGGIGYFNYNDADSRYGPNNWRDVVNNPEHLRYKELEGTHQRSLINRCNDNSRQSPIDLCEHKINSECQEHHQTRTHSGNILLGPNQPVTPQILPSKLRLKYYPDRTPEGGPYPPEADFAHHWNGYVEVNHVDLKIPSEHSVCSKVYPAELSIFMLHPLRRQTIVMSILMDFDPSDADNDHFQKAIDQWQILFDENQSRCNIPPTGPMRGLLDETHITEGHVPFSGIPNNSTRLDSQNIPPPNDDYDLLRSNPTNQTIHRRLRDDSPYGRGGWDPFHPSLERSIYHWGYWGSLTEPPCSTFVAWRVLTEPAYISKKQWNQLRTILFTNKDENCKYTSVAHDFSVARPIQPLQGRDLYKCRPSDYVSDIEKKRMREETGNPNWCC